MRAKISIIVPVYNVEKYLDRCVASILGQSLKDYEVILVDDGSTDSSGAMCERYAEQDNRIKVVHKENGGLGEACNTGMEHAQGEYILFVDSDDWIDERMCETLYDLGKRNNANLVFSGIRMVDENNESSTLGSYSKDRQILDFKIISLFALDMIASDARERVERSVPMSAKITLYNNDFLKRHHLRFESERKFISEDLLFNLDCLMKAECIVLSKGIFYNYYVNNASLSRKIRTDRFDKALILRREVLRRYSDRIKDTDLKERVDRMFIGYSRVACCQIVNCKTLSIRERYNLLKKLVNNEVWKEIARDYPIDKMPLKHRLFLRAILNRNIFAISLFSLINGL